MNNFPDNTRSSWPDHFTNGGTGITKFQARDLPLYEQAIKQHRDMFLRGNELHCNRPVLPEGLSPFWETFKKLKNARAALAEAEGKENPQHDPDHLNPEKGGNRAGDDYWRE